MSHVPELVAGALRRPDAPAATRYLRSLAGRPPVAPDTERALERYDPQRGVPFWGYAVAWVRQAMQQLVAELMRPTVLSDRALRHLARVREAHLELLAETRAEPSLAALAERSGLAREQVNDLLAVERPPRSLEAPLEAEDGAVGTFGDLIADPLSGSGSFRAKRGLDGLAQRGRAVAGGDHGA
jgi:hypothetical protein